MLEFFSRRKGQPGFTLIELLVVIAIIGILATIVLVSLNTARSKARDVRRVSDLRQVALALEMYYDDEDTYPGTSGTCTTIPAALATDYIGAIPEDPGTTEYAYGVESGGQNYVLRATMENDVPDADIDATTYSCACDDASKYYCITP
ncbi:MAG: type II secretion system protein [Candidatus Portnoybacteria bacterium]|nr:type II secretion system protein [Candidatus Portnoybacteria bacterium]